MIHPLHQNGTFGVREHCEQTEVTNPQFVFVRAHESCEKACGILGPFLEAVDHSACHPLI
jgi:hypothetical protein